MSMKVTMTLDDDADVKCGWCGEHSKLKLWNDLTWDKCTNREMKRAFTKLNNPIVFNPKTDVYYICPKCERWSKGCQLKIVNTEDERLLRLGGAPTIKMK